MKNLLLKLEPIISILFLCVTTVNSSFADEGISDDKSVLNKILCPEQISNNVIENYKPNYFIWRPDEIKFQFSAVTQIAEGCGLFFAYTQKSFWDIASNSRPFKESNYNPEFFSRYDIREWPTLFKGGKSGIKVGWLEHESNGLSTAQSRSWNRFYLELYSTNNNNVVGPMVTIKFWHPYGLDDNANIANYYGYQELFAMWPVEYISKSAGLAFTARGNVAKHHGSVSVDFFVPIKRIYFYAQAWSGYGESLLNYDKKTDRFRIGIMMQPRNSANPLH